MSVYCTPRIDGPNSVHEKNPKMFVKVKTSKILKLSRINTVLAPTVLNVVGRLALVSVLNISMCNSHSNKFDTKFILDVLLFLQGAPEGIIERCNYMRVGSKKQPLTPKTKQQILDLVKTYGTGLY